MSGSRIAKWDNVKLTLIYLVVFGHVCDQFSHQFAAAQVLFLFIYTFHMPAFLFVSGMFSKRTVNADRLDWRKVAPYLVLCVFLNFYRWVSIYAYNRDHYYNLTSQSNISWYLLVLFVFLVVTHLVRKVDPKYVLIVSVLIAIMVGYDPRIGKLLGASRCFTFFPFFYLGYALDREKLTAFVEKTWVKIASAALLVVWLVLCLKVPILYAFRPLFTGQNWYGDLSFGFHIWNGLFRAIWYFLALGLTLAVFALAPKKDIPHVSVLGSHTLSVYFWHLPILYLIVNGSLVRDFVGTSTLRWLIGGLLFAALLTVVFAQKIFMKPLLWVLYPPQKQ